MWEKEVRIYDIPGVHNNFPGFQCICHKSCGKEENQRDCIGI